MQDYRVARDPYLRIASRNIGMSRILHMRNFYEGAVFHACHAFECIISSGIASQNRAIPKSYNRWLRMTSHAQKLYEFRMYCLPLIRNTPLQMEFATLSVVLVSLSSTTPPHEGIRNDALYLINGIEPHNRFRWEDSLRLTWRVRRFLHQALIIFPDITVP